MSARTVMATNKRHKKAYTQSGSLEGSTGPLMGVVRNFIFVLWIKRSKYQPADDKSSLKGAWSGSRDPFLHLGDQVCSG